MSSDTTLQILKEAIKLAGEHTQDFDEVSLSKQLNIPLDELRKQLTDELSLFFHIIRKQNITCSKCHSVVDIEKGLTYCVCKDCNTEIDITNQTLLSIGLRVDKIEEFLVEYITKILNTKDFEERDSDENFVILRNKKNDLCLAISISIECDGLRDYFSLRGWANDYHPSTYLIISNSFDKYLKLYEDKDLKCTLIQIDNILNDVYVNQLLVDIQKKQEVLEKQKKMENQVQLEFRKFGKLAELEDNHKEIINSITLRALQRMDEGVKKQGSKFEKDIVKILNFTILRTKYLAAGNEPDGLSVILRYNNDRTKWYPLEIKSFTPTDEEKPFYPLKEVTIQLAKYINAFLNEEITSRVDIPAFIAIAYDFDIENKDEQAIIQAFENKYKTKLVLFPLKSIIRLLCGFHENNIFNTPPDDIQKFIINNNYITPEQVDELISNLTKSNHDKYQEDLKIVRAKVKEQGK